MCEVEEEPAARVEVQAQKRRAVIRVESEESQDYVRERFVYEDFSQEESDESGFVPCALSEPRGAIHWCDNRCGEKSLRYIQIASLVTEGGGINLCRPRNSEREQTLKVAEWRDC